MLRPVQGMGVLISLCSIVFSVFAQTGTSTPPGSPARVRARDLNIAPGVFPTGKWNAITDVAGVRVGHTTLWEGDNVRTGVTAILPPGDNPHKEKLPAAIFVGNGFGKLLGFTQVQELGVLETPVLLTNTLSVWRVADALVDYMLALPGNEDVRSINPVVGETNDGYLNDIRGRHVTRKDVFNAILSAKSGPVEEGSVGAGTGTAAFDWKGGIGTSSRVLPPESGGYTLGVLVQTNFGGHLTIDGVPVWRELPKNGKSGRPGDGSCMIVIATDTPLDAHQLQRVSRRALAGMARTGSTFSNGSGDYVIAFSTALRGLPTSDTRSTGGRAKIQDEELSPLFEAATEATEEAIYNSLLQATTVRGRDGHVVEAIPIEGLKQILSKFNRGI
ncbi:MAG: P1 family peptidase [Acidobacteriia bacterium]|nr:P1 family peptidase [Terriglobia bacterium]